MSTLRFSDSEKYPCGNSKKCILDPSLKIFSMFFFPLYRCFPKQLRGGGGGGKRPFHRLHFEKLTVLNSKYQPLQVNTSFASSKLLGSSMGGRVDQAPSGGLNTGWIHTFERSLTTENMRKTQFVHRLVRHVLIITKGLRCKCPRPQSLRAG